MKRSLLLLFDILTWYWYIFLMLMGFCNESFKTLKGNKQTVVCLCYELNKITVCCGAVILAVIDV